MSLLDADAVRAALAQSNANNAVHALHEHCITLQGRKILLSTLFYPLYTYVLNRIFDNRTRPSLLCCDLVTIQLLTPPLPAVPATSTARAQPSQDAGSLFALLFRTASFPPMFVAPVRSMLPVPLQRMMLSVPPQHLPAWFRARAVQQQQASAGGAGGGGVEFLELSLYEYYFLSCVAFITQGDIHVQSSAPNITVSSRSAASGAGEPPSPEAYNAAFMRLLLQMLEFFVPARGRHSSSLRLEEGGWNVPSILAQGNTLVEVLAETLMGQFSYEAAQALPNAASAAGGGGGSALAPVPGTPFPYGAFGAGGGGALTPMATPFGGGGGGGGHMMYPSFALPLDEHTLPNAKTVQAIMRLIYHLLEAGTLEAPIPGSPERVAACATRASIIAYTSEKYTLHAESQITRCKVDWHLFGLLQHCFTRWAPEWSTAVGQPPVLQVSANAVSGSGAGAGGFSTVPPTRTEDRLTKLVELWLDYLEPWKSLYNEEYSPHFWKWWIVSNLPFYTVLMKDFLRLITRIDLGREQSSLRTAHLKTVLHLLKIFEGAVLEAVEEVESTLVRSVLGGGAGQSSLHSQQFSRGGPTGATSESQQSVQQELFVLRHAVQHLSGQRPEQYIPVFPAAGALLPSSAGAGMGGSKSGGAGGLFTSPQRGGGQFASPSLHARHSSRAGGHDALPPVARMLESQQISLRLIRLYSMGYTNAEAISLAREQMLLDAPSAPPSALSAAAAAAAAQRGGQVQQQQQGLSLLVQEEQLGQHIEKRLRAIFRLPDAPTSSEESARRGGGSATPRNNFSDGASAAAAAAASGAASGSILPFAGVPPPRHLRDLEPDRSEGDAFGRLSLVGRAQIRAGQRICSRGGNIPILGGDEARPCGSDEIAALLPLTRTLARKLNERWGLPKRKGGFEFQLRFLAHREVLTTIASVLLVFILLIALLFRSRS